MNLRFIMKLHKLAILLFAIMILFACGQKGDLTISDKQVTATLISSTL